MLDLNEQQRELLVQIYQAHRKLIDEHEWQDAMYAPADYSPLLLIEAGSTGIHRGYRDDIGFWVHDVELYPSNPILFKRLLKIVGAT